MNVERQRGLRHHPRGPLRVTRPRARATGCLIGAVVSLLPLGCVTPGSPQPAEAPPILPGIRLDRSTAAVLIDGHMCLESGILEYVGVVPGGKEYESLFSLNCRPAHLQTALLLAGYEPGDLPDVPHDDEPLPATEPAPAQPPAIPTYVTLDVEVRRPDGSWQRRPIEEFLVVRKTGQPPERLTWAFTGSFFVRDAESAAEYFAADLEGSLIALWFDPIALLNLARDVGNPYRGDDLGLAVSRAAAPPRGTPIRLVLSPAPRRPS